MSQYPDPYTVLGVAPAASPTEITHAFRVKLRALHPDTRRAEPAGTETQLRQLLAAYNLLRRSGKHTDAAANAEPAAPTAAVAYKTTTTAHDPESSRASTDPGHLPPHTRPNAPEELALWAGPVRWQR